MGGAGQVIGAGRLGGRFDIPAEAGGPIWRHAVAVAPGLVLTSSLVWLAYAIRQQIGAAALSPLIVSIALGIVFHNLIGTPARALPGVKLAVRRVLRFAIVLLGLQLTAAQVSAVGYAGFAVIGGSLLATFVATKAFGRLLGVDRGLTELIAAGTSICGASAVIATNTVTRAPDEDVAYAVACVTVFGSLAMLAYPLLDGALHLPPLAYGLWSGASIHEVAQVVAAAFQGGPAAGEFGTVAKLTRVMMLAPLVISLGLVPTRHPDRLAARAPVPWFVLGFLGLIAVNSLVAIPTAVKAPLLQLTTFLLAMALAGMGLETDIGRLAAKGLRPLLLGAIATLFISVLSLILVLLLAPS